MDKNIIVSQLKELKLYGMADAAYSLLSAPATKRLTLERALAQMIENETRERDDKRAQRLLRGAKLPMKATPELIDCQKERNLLKEDVDELITCEFIRSGQNLLISALTGCGKTYLACALGYQACLLGFKVIYLHANRFINDLCKWHLQGTATEELDRLCKNDLIILDDLGLVEATPEFRIALFTILEERSGKKKSVIFTSQLPVNDWYDYIKDQTIADAVVDRLLAGAIEITLTGASKRPTKIRKMGLPE